MFFQKAKKGLHPRCKSCRREDNAQQRASRAEREKKQAELEKLSRTEEALNAKGVALPRTFTPQKWDGVIQQGYVRNDGNKHIKSRGLI